MLFILVVLLSDELAKGILYLRAKSWFSMGCCSSSNVVAFRRGKLKVTSSTLPGRSDETHFRTRYAQFQMCLLAFECLVKDL
jgi:hypothetical protein